MTDIVSPSTPSAFGTKISQKHKCTSPNGMQMKNQQNTINIVEKLDVTSQLEKGEQIVDICCNVSLADGIVRTVRANADEIPESAKSGTKVFV